MRDPDALLSLILTLHADVRDEIVAATERHGLDQLASIDRDEPLLQETLRARKWIDDEG